MTFFYDELPREPKILKPWQRWIRRIAWGIFIFFVMMWIALRALMTLGGNNPQLARGLEEYLRGATGMETHIGRFGGVTFYPFISVDIGEVRFMRPGVPGWSAATLGHLTMRASFWDLFFHRGTIAQFDLRDLDLGDSLNLAQPLRFDHIALDKAAHPGDAALTLDGHFGPDAFNGAVAMAWRTGAMGRPAFFLPPRGALTFSSPPLSLTGTLTRRQGGGLTLDGLHVTMPNASLAGSLTLITTIGSVHWLGDIAGGNTHTAVDLEYGPQTLSGVIDVKRLDLNDGTLLMAVIRDSTGIVPSAVMRAALLRRDGKIKLRIAALTMGQDTLGDLFAPFIIDHGLMTASSLSGSLGGGKLTGRAVLDTRGQGPLSFETKGRVDGWRIGSGADPFHGDALFALHGTAADISALPGALAGEIAARGAGGRLGAAVSGAPPELANANVPCLLADIPVASGTATLSPLILQLGNMRLAGWGHVMRDGMDAALAAPQGYALHGNWDHLVLTPTAVDPRAAAMVKQPPGDMFKAFSRGDLGLAPGGACTALLP